MNKTLYNLQQPELEQFEEEMNNVEVEDIELNNREIIIHFITGGRLIITAKKQNLSKDRIRAVLNCEFDE